MIEYNDVREYVFPLYLAPHPQDPVKEPVYITGGQYLGTAFFLSRDGLALTAAHCVPDPSRVGANRFFAGLWDGTHVRSHPILAAEVLDNFDVAVLQIENVTNARFFPVRFNELHMGLDVACIGIPAHSVSGRSARCLGSVHHIFTRFALAPDGTHAMSGRVVCKLGKSRQARRIGQRASGPGI